MDSPFFSSTGQKAGLSMPLCETLLHGLKRGGAAGAGKMVPKSRHNAGVSR
jgi:hypothetical protein